MQLPLRVTFPFWIAVWKLRRHAILLALIPSVALLVAGGWCAPGTVPDRCHSVPGAGRPHLQCHLGSP